MKTRATSRLLENHIYRPQRSWAKVMFLQASVIQPHRGWAGGCLPQWMPGYHPPPQEQTRNRDQTPPPRQTRHHPPRKADASIRSMSGRYASYWNAFLWNFTFRVEYFCTFTFYNLGFVYIEAKAMSLPDGFIENPIKYSHWAATEIEEKIRFRSV